MVPNGWEKTTFGEHIDLLNGFAFKSALYSDDENDIKLLRGDNIEPNKLRWHDVKRWSKTEYESLEKYHLKENDFIIAMDRTWITAGLKVAEVKQEDLPCLLVQRVSRIRSLPTLCQDLIKHHFSSYQFEQYVKSVQTETAVPHISATQIREFGLLLPPLPEQQKIAKILSTWDKAISTTERLIDNSSQQKKALMQQLLTGKKRLLDDEGERFEGEWDWVDLEDVCDVKGGKRLPKGNALSEAKTSNPYIRVADMYMGGVDLSDIKYVPESIAPLIKNYTISKDDLFITVAGTLGIVGKIPNELDGANLTENADKLTNIKCDKTFLLYVMMSSIIQRYIEAESTQNAQPKLALARIRGFKVPLPNLEEQQKIAIVLTNADKEIELLEQQLADLQQEKKALMQVLLTGKKRVVVDG